MCNKRQRGLTLIELVMFIVIVGVALAGVLLVMNRVTAHSADPLIRKQSLAIAESLLEEIELMPFTYCDPDDPAAASATSAAGCTTAEAVGPETGETRYSTTTPFDNVNDYHGFAMSGGIVDITNTPVIGLESYQASVTVAPANFADITQARGDALRITITVTGPDNIPVVLEGYRTRYSPNAVP
ncbi:MAG: prepilin-type N-terminal cleavage/methylation domain-containing protein [Pseudomonadota bacterium]